MLAYVLTVTSGTNKTLYPNHWAARKSVPLLIHRCRVCVCVRELCVAAA